MRVLVLAAFFLTSCCCKYDDEDFQFMEIHNKLLNLYSKGDTIYFSDAHGDLDTITVKNIDTLQQCGCAMVGNRRAISIEIQHLPVNKWTGGTEMFQNKPPKILDQDLIVIEKNFYDNGPKYFIGLNYRNFMGELADLTKMNSDDRYEKLRVRRYWTISNAAADWNQHKQDLTVITKVYWTEQFGLTGYELRDGRTFELVQNVP